MTGGGDLALILPPPLSFARTGGARELIQPCEGEVLCLTPAGTFKHVALVGIHATCFIYLFSCVFYPKTAATPRVNPEGMLLADTL